MNLQAQSEHYWSQITTRRRNPAKGATLSAYQSYLKKWILPELGKVELAQVENGVMKKFVAKLSSSGLSASTIAGVTNCVKGIVGSAMDENGNQLYPRVWNTDFIDAPVINLKAQEAPIITAQEVVGAIKNAPGQFRPLFALLAGSGLRISEALALKVGPNQTSSYWDRDRSVLVIRKAMYRGLEQSTKTPAGVREIDLAPELNTFLCNETPQIGGFWFTNSNGQTMRVRTAYDVAQKAGVPGYHSFRRFRTTHLRGSQVPEDIIQFWIGHSGKTITDRYSKLSQDIEVRKTWAVKAGLGFELPS